MMEYILCWLTIPGHRTLPWIMVDELRLAPFENMGFLFRVNGFSLSQQVSILNNFLVSSGTLCS